MVWHLEGLNARPFITAHSLMTDKNTFISRSCGKVEIDIHIVRSYTCVTKVFLWKLEDHVKNKDEKEGKERFIKHIPINDN